MPLERPEFNAPRPEVKTSEAKEKHELSPEFVKRIEELNTTIDGKVNFILTKVGLKPASEICLDIKATDEKGRLLNRFMSEKELKEAVEFIKKAGLPVLIKKRGNAKEEYGEAGVPRFREIDRVEILVGSSRADLDFLAQAMKSGSNELLGKAFGFPPTAVEAFVGKRKRLDTAKLPKETQKSDAMLFTTPCLSEDNWQEEIKQGQVYADFIKRISPKLYEEWRAMYMQRVDDPSGRFLGQV